MKGFTTLLVLFCAQFSYGQQAAGSWTGELDIMGTKLPLNFHIAQEDGEWKATMDSPMQGAMGLAMSTCTVEGDRLHLTMNAAGIDYQAQIFPNQLKGTFRQGGMEMPLDMERVGAEGVQMAEAPVRDRPQEPKRPFPYVEEEVSFRNDAAGIKLYGTLTLPKGEGPFPAVILITGSGPQDRNSEILGHKPFLVISDYLTRQGIAVLRYDERGVGASEGDFSEATSADFAADAAAALNWLNQHPKVNPNKTGAIGHSEGGIVAPMMTQYTEAADFLILMAGTGVRGDELLMAQKRDIELAMGLDKEEVMDGLEKMSDLYRLFFDDSLSEEALERSVRERLGDAFPDLPEQQREASAQQLLTPWMRYFIRHDPGKVLEQVSVPVLVVNGAHDLQVAADINVRAIEAALIAGGNMDVSTRIFPGLNHLFQNCDTGLPSNYENISETFAEEVMAFMAEWILSR